MNIDLRNIDFEDELKEIMKAERFATASKCIKSVILEHQILHKRIKQLNEQLATERRENIKLLEEKEQIKKAVKIFKQILT